eukprot:SAG31_NODE_922_length_10976_cov_8.838742_10_plen_317_part_00
MYYTAVASPRHVPPAPRAELAPARARAARRLPHRPRMHPPSTPMSAQHKLLLPLLTVLHAPGFASSNQACRLKASALPRFRYETMYGWHASMANFTPQSQSSSITEIVDFHNATRRPGILELQGVFFQDMKKSHPTLRGQMVKPTAIADWEALLPKIKPLIAQKIIIGFMLGDEIVWNNVSWVDLDAIATRVKGDCPEPFLFYNEGGAPLWGNYNVNHMHTEYPHIPAAVDYVSTDDYDTIVSFLPIYRIRRVSAICNCACIIMRLCLRAEHRRVQRNADQAHLECSLAVQTIPVPKAPQAPKSLCDSADIQHQLP